MRGPAKGIWYHAYVVLDIFSHYVAGWRVERIDDGQLAADLVQEIVADTGGHPPGYLHTDGGAAMTSRSLASMLVDMDITRSHSRPHTSNDNPFSETQYKTMKYTSDYPERFASANEARNWVEGFTAYYNHEHRHSGIGYHTPASVHYGTAGTVCDQRQTTLDRAYKAHPERFARRPAAPPLPLTAAINDPAKRAEPAIH